MSLEAPENVCTSEGVDRVVRDIDWWHMKKGKVRLVVGSELYYRSLAEIDFVIENGPHVQEGDAFIAYFKDRQKRWKERQSKDGSSKEHGRSRSRTSRLSKERQSKEGESEQKKRSRSRSRGRSSFKSKHKEKRSNNKSRASSSSSSPSPNNKNKNKEDTKKSSKKKIKKSRSKSFEKEKQSPLKSKHSKKDKRDKSKERDSSPSPSPKKKAKEKIRKSKKKSLKSKSSSPEPDSKSYIKWCLKDAEQRYVEKKHRKEEKYSKVKKNPKDKKSPKEKENTEDNKNENETPAPKVWSRPKSPEILYSSSSPSPVNGSKTPVLQVLSETHENIGVKVEKFFKAEADMLKSLEREKDRFYALPSSHPEYQKEWAKFWVRHQQNGITMVGGAEKTMIIEAKWVTYWKEFFDDSHEKTMQDRRKVLLEKHGITATDIEEFMLKKGSEPDVIVLDSSDDDGGGGASSTAQSKAQQNNSNQEIVSEDVSLLPTLRFLTSLASAGCLGEGLGSRLEKLQETALTLESSQFGGSEALVTERECSSLLDQARERLGQRLEHGRVVAGHREVARLTLQKLAVLLARAGVEREEVLEIEVSDPQEAAIRRQLEQEVRATGQRVTPKELAALVQAECVRARLALHRPPPALALDPNFLVQPDWGAFTNIFNVPLGGLPNEGVIEVIEPTEPQPSTSSGSSSSAARASNNSSRTASSSAKVQSPARLPDIKAEPMESLTEEEVVELVKNFKTLDTEDQKELIAYMRRLEDSDPEKVTRLKKRLYM